MKKILIPVDYSVNSNDVLDFGLMLANQYAAELFLLNVLEIPMVEATYNTTGDFTNPTAAAMDVDLYQSMVDTSQKNMQRLLLDNRFRNVIITHLIEPGTVSATVSEVAERQQVDLIILGTNGAKGLGGTILGSNAEDIVKSTEIPVITIKNKVRALPKTIVFASDFSEEIKVFFPAAHAFAIQLGASMHFLFVNTIENFATTRNIKQEIGQFCSKNNLDYPVTIYNDFTREEGILHFAEDIKADMIALGSHRKGSLAHFFSGSISEDLVNHSEIPVLTIKARS